MASAASIDFLRPAFAGDRLVATARVKQQGKLTGVYDIERLINSKIVALFRGIAPHRRHNHGRRVMRDAFRRDPYAHWPLRRRAGQCARRRPAAIPLRELLSRNPGSTRQHMM